MPYSVTRQTSALMRRQCIYLMNRPITSLITHLLWPCAIIGPVIYLASSVQPDFDSTISNSFIFAPRIMFVATAFIAYSLACRMVADRSTGFKSLMISMGLQRISYYMAYIIFMLLNLLPISLIFSWISLTYVITDSEESKVLVVILFSTCSIQLISCMFALVSFITSTSYQSIILLLLLLQEGPSFLINLGMPKLVEWRWLLIFLDQISPYASIKIFSQSYLLNKNNGTIDFDPKSSNISAPTYLLIIYSLLWILISFSFSRWFEEVCPWQEDSAVRSPWFCLESSKQNVDRTFDEPEESSVNKAYQRFFEKRPLQDGRQVGIRISGLKKYFGIVLAVDNVSFNIYKGETTLLLGHNGAGKSTLMNMIIGLLQPTSGRLMIKDFQRIGRSGVGLCPQLSVVDDQMTVKQHLEFFVDIKSSMENPERMEHILETLNDVNLMNHANKRPPELSGGMKRKLSLGMAFIGNSEILILDEPSSGLDPDSRVFIWNAIRRYRAERTVLLSTQHMEEADYLGDRIAIMSSGQIVCCGSSTFLNKLFGSGYKLRIECLSSKRRAIFDRILKYFEAAKPDDLIEDQLNLPSPSQSGSHHRSRSLSIEDQVVDFILELRTKKDSEMEMINLLEYLENEGEELGIRSYGLKSSSIEDVMLHTSKYFSETPTGTTRVAIQNTENNIATLVDSATDATIPSCCNHICAMFAKSISYYCNDWMSILVYRIALPLGVMYYIISNMNPEIRYIPDTVLIFIGAHYIRYPVMERATKFKTIQLTSNMRIDTYWLSFVIADSLTILFHLIAWNILLANVLSSKVKVVADLHLVCSLALFGYSMAMLAFSYMLSVVLNEHNSAISYLVIISFIMTILFYVAKLIEFIIAYRSYNLSRVSWLSDTIGWIGIAFIPSNAFRYILSSLYDENYIDFAWSPPNLRDLEQGRAKLSIWFGFGALIFQMALYSLLLILAEYQNIDLSYYLNLRNWYRFMTRVSINPDQDNRLVEVDSDVREEKTKAMGEIDRLARNRFGIGSTNRDSPSPNKSRCPSLVAFDLKKSYLRGVQVVNGLSFTVHRGECFGLLGINGAGKTTTFSMLVAETKPDEGQIWANGYFIEKNLNKYRETIGYDPQASPDIFLNPSQAIRLMARLRGLPSYRIEMLINSLLELLEMREHQSKTTAKLSGGTKRKLALGMALIGNRRLLILDEPTAGVDPLARRSVWQLLKSLRRQNKASIVISSHAMEECEAICDRISIMARGQLRCVGTFLHLRSKFAKGCTLRVQISNSQILSSTSISRQAHQVAAGPKEQDQIEQIVVELQQLLGEAIGQSVFKLADKNINSATFNITDNRVRRSILFRIMREFRQKHSSLSYMINDASLEDIFISLAKENPDQ